MIDYTLQRWDTAIFGSDSKYIDFIRHPHGIKLLHVVRLDIELPMHDKSIRKKELN